MTSQQAERLTAETILQGKQVVYEQLPNGLVRLRDKFGWVFLREDGSEHSRQYN